MWDISNGEDSTMSWRPIAVKSQFCREQIQLEATGQHSHSLLQHWSSWSRSDWKTNCKASRLWEYPATFIWNGCGNSECPFMTSRILTRESDAIAIDRLWRIKWTKNPGGTNPGVLKVMNKGAAWSWWLTQSLSASPWYNFKVQGRKNSLSLPEPSEHLGQCHNLQHSFIQGLQNNAVVNNTGQRVLVGSNPSFRLRVSSFPRWSTSHLGLGSHYPGGFQSKGQRGGLQLHGRTWGQWAQHAVQCDTLLQQLSLHSTAWLSFLASSKPFERAPLSLVSRLTACHLSSHIFLLWLCWILGLHLPHCQLWCCQLPMEVDRACQNTAFWCSEIRSLAQRQLHQSAWSPWVPTNIIHGYSTSWLLLSGLARWPKMAAIH